jgi:Family of unknown function (DUF1028)
MDGDGDYDMLIASALPTIRLALWQNQDGKLSRFLRSSLDGVRRLHKLHWIVQLKQQGVLSMLLTLRQLIVWILSLSVILAAQFAAAQSTTNEQEKAKEEISRTFSIVAVDPVTGECGAAVASKYPAVGRVVPYVRADVGAFCTQHYHVPAWGEPALDALASGKSPSDVLADLLRVDQQPEQRQLAIIDMQGRTANHNPTQAGDNSRWWGAMAGRNYCFAFPIDRFVRRDIALIAIRSSERLAAGELVWRRIHGLLVGRMFPYRDGR